MASIEFTNVKRHALLVAVGVLFYLSLSVKKYFCFPFVWFLTLIFKWGLGRWILKIKCSNMRKRTCECICMNRSLCCSAEISTTLWTNYTLIKIKISIYFFLHVLCFAKTFSFSFCFKSVCDCLLEHLYNRWFKVFVRQLQCWYRLGIGIGLALAMIIFFHVCWGKKAGSSHAT